MESIGRELTRYGPAKGQLPLRRGEGGGGCDIIAKVSAPLAAWTQVSDNATTPHYTLIVTPSHGKVEGTTGMLFSNVVVLLRER